MTHRLELTDDLTRENLFLALEHAISIIESYQMEIANWQDGSGQTLADIGFCQGSIFANAVPQTFRMARGEWSPYIEGHLPRRITVLDRFTPAHES